MKQTKILNRYTSSLALYHLQVARELVCQDQSSGEVIPLYIIAKSLELGQASPTKSHRTYCPYTAFCQPCIFFSMHSRATLQGLHRHNLFKPYSHSYVLNQSWQIMLGLGEGELSAQNEDIPCELTGIRGVCSYKNFCIFNSSQNIITCMFVLMLEIGYSMSLMGWVRQSVLTFFEKMCILLVQHASIKTY